MFSSTCASHPEPEHPAGDWRPAGHHPVQCELVLLLGVSALVQDGHRVRFPRHHSCSAVASNTRIKFVNLKIFNLAQNKLVTCWWQCMCTPRWMSRWRPGWWGWRRWRAGPPQLPPSPQGCPPSGGGRHDSSPAPPPADSLSQSTPASKQPSLYC